ncbi:hypothetical protein PYCCODRAFT_1467807 [Trametes coccinea BRFM310]|uniref:Uncharacterized protein n=1 Tax=Trametes coccinea (strain BRFM310) TaxID=1353009 RepID=A0A1Y2IP99_TRAC3|nr:hypothetical protein PYCCODRAFT_1467807 [Trametes coccinea BRFM310]
MSSSERSLATLPSTARTILIRKEPVTVRTATNGDSPFPCYVTATALGPTFAVGDKVQFQVLNEEPNLGAPQTSTETMPPQTLQDIPVAGSILSVHWPPRGGTVYLVKNDYTDTPHDRVWLHVPGNVSPSMTGGLNPSDLTSPLLAALRDRQREANCMFAS